LGPDLFVLLVKLGGILLALVIVFFGLFHELSRDSLLIFDRLVGSDASVNI